jgi:L-threonylcarbamoyladenylate synthase
VEIISNPTKVDIQTSAKALKDGHLIAFPTETVYGLGADATNEKAISRIYSVKGRPTNHPLIVHISSINKLNKWAKDIPSYAINLAREFWPGPLTLILKRSILAKDYITGGQESIALRVPQHPTAQKLLIEFERIGGEGVAAPSANKYGAVSPTSTSAVLQELESSLDHKDIVLGSDICRIGIESTIISCLNDTPQILRPGYISKESILERFTELDFVNTQSKKLRYPGNLKKHYSPIAKISINKTPKVGEGLIALRSYQTPKGVFRLSAPIDIEQYARELYSAFRLADEKGIEQISVILPGRIGLANAIWDRVYKASGAP